MNQSCKNCLWRYVDRNTDCCICEDEEVFKSETQFTDQCIGYLEEKFETKMMDLYDECVELLSKKQYEELLLVKDFLKERSPHDSNTRRFK